MTKVELIKKVHAKIGEELNLSKSAVEAVVNTTLDTMKEILETEGELRLRGLGTFYVENRPSRKARNPKTGEQITVPPKNVVKFRVSAKLLEAVN